MKRGIALFLACLLVFSLVSSQVYAIDGDTNLSTWAVKEVQEAEEYGLLNSELGNDYTRFITREEFSRLVVNMVEEANGEELPFEDDPFDDTSDIAILKAYGTGIVKGTSKTAFSPDSNITRQEIAVMLIRAIRVNEELLGRTFLNDTYVGEDLFADEDQIADWAMTEVIVSNKYGIMNGVGQNHINPLGNTTVEQAIILVKRLYEKQIIDENTVEDVNLPVMIPDILFKDDDESGNGAIISGKYFAGEFYYDVAYEVREGYAMRRLEDVIPYKIGNSIDSYGFRIWNQNTALFWNKDEGIYYSVNINTLKMQPTEIDSTIRFAVPGWLIAGESGKTNIYNEKFEKVSEIDFYARQSNYIKERNSLFFYSDEEESYVEYVLEGNIEKKYLGDFESSEMRGWEAVEGNEINPDKTILLDRIHCNNISIISQYNIQEEKFVMSFYKTREFISLLSITTPKSISNIKPIYQVEKKLPLDSLYAGTKSEFHRDLVKCHGKTALMSYPESWGGYGWPNYLFALEDNIYGAGMLFINMYDYLYDYHNDMSMMKFNDSFLWIAQETEELQTTFFFSGNQLFTEDIEICDIYKPNTVYLLKDESFAKVLMAHVDGKDVQITPDGIIELGATDNEWWDYRFGIDTSIQEMSIDLFDLRTLKHNAINTDVQPDKVLFAWSLDAVVYQSGESIYYYDGSNDIKLNVSVGENENVYFWESNIKGVSAFSIYNDGKRDRYAMYHGEITEICTLDEAESMEFDEENAVAICVDRQGNLHTYDLKQGENNIYTEGYEEVLNYCGVNEFYIKGKDGNVYYYTDGELQLVEVD